jgi:hypothetical protein
MAQGAERGEARFPGGLFRKFPGLFGLQGFYLRRSVDDTNLGIDVGNPTDFARACAAKRPACRPVQRLPVSMT